MAKEPIPAGAFVVEYTGEVISEKERLDRMMKARQRGRVHFYIMELSKGLYIDAEHFGSNARFMNSSCDPNCETQKWKDASTGVQLHYLLLRMAVFIAGTVLLHIQGPFVAHIPVSWVRIDHTCKPMLAQRSLCGRLIVMSISRLLGGFPGSSLI